MRILPFASLALAAAYWLTAAGIFSTDWPNLLARWGHMIAGIAWIGTSFYFVALDFSLRKGAGLPAGAGKLRGVAAVGDCVSGDRCLRTRRLHRHPSRHEKRRP